MPETPQMAQLRAKLRAPGDPWDSARYRMPDPDAPAGERLAWYEMFTRHVLARGSICDFDIRYAAAAADRAARREFADAGPVASRR